MSGRVRGARLVGAAVLGTVALATPVAHATDASDAVPPTGTVHERGTVVVCSGQWRDQPVARSVHGRHPHVRVLVRTGGAGEVPPRVVRTPGHRLVRDRGLHERGWLAGHRLDLSAVVVRDGNPVPVHEEHEDGEQHVVVDGTQQPLAATTTFTWRHRAATLACPGSFRYDHTVTRTDAEAPA